MLEVIKRLRAQREDVLRAFLRGELLGKRHELAPVALAFVRFCHVETRKLRLLRFGVKMHSGAGDELPVHFESPIVIKLRHQLGTRALHQFCVLDARFDQREHCPHILLKDAPDLLVIVSVNHRAHAFGAKHLREQRLIRISVQQMHARHSVPAGACAVLDFGKRARVELSAALFYQILRFCYAELLHKRASYFDAVACAEIDHFHRLQSLGDFHGDGVAVHAESAPFTIETNRRHYGNCAVVEQELEEFRIHALDLAGVLKIHAAQNTCGVRDDHICVGGAQIHARETLHDVVHQRRRRIERNFERRFIGDAGAVRIARFHATLGGKLFDLHCCAVNEHDAHVQRTQHGEIEQDGGEIWRRHDLAIHRDDECLFAEARDVSKNAAQIGDFH